VGDVNGDGRMDLLEKDGWHEQPASLDGDPIWVHHPYRFAGPGGAQMFAYDVNGDGLKDIVTGKRFWSHGRLGDPDRNDEAVLYWFELTRGPEGVDYVPHQIDTNSGVGTQIVAGDVNGDSRPDVIVGNKKGVFVHLQVARPATAAEAEAARPKPLPWPKKATAVAAVAADGRRLNFDFETGDLTDWTAEGAAFAGAVVKGDAVAARRQDMRSGHAGEHWVGGYEKAGDAPTGTLTSTPFILTQPYLRVVDEAVDGWGHVNFDDVLFYDAPPPEAREVRP